MCARYNLALPDDLVAKHFGAEVGHSVEQLSKDRPLAPRYNAAPTQMLPVILLTTEGGRTMEAFRWGLLPIWAKDLKDGTRCLNAKAETILTLNSFRSAMKSKRCIVPVTGYYEWIAGAGKERLPFHIHRKDGRPFAFAGLWELWKNEEGEEVRTFTIATVPAASSLAHLHDRMPAFLEPADYDNWMDTARVSAPDAATLLRTYDGEEALEAVRVSTAVNSARTEGAELMLPLSSSAPPL